MKCNKGNKDISLFTINYKKQIVKFKRNVFDKKEMILKEFALTILGIEPISTEVIAMYIGKMGFETYNKGNYELHLIKKVKNGVKGYLKINTKDNQ